MREIHRSDCAQNNEPALPNEPCDCWWLISGADISYIATALEQLPDGPLKTDAIYTLDSGLHITNAIPEDFNLEVK